MKKTTGNNNKLLLILLFQPIAGPELRRNGSANCYAK